MIFGDPGVGKTVFAGSASQVAELGPVLYIDAEGGVLSLRERYPNVDVVRVKSFVDVAKVLEQLRKGDHGYKTVVVDSLTEIQKFGMYYIMGAAITKDPDRDPDLPGIGEWGKNTEQMRKLVRAFRDLPINCIFTALAAVDIDKKAQRTIRPAMSGKLSSEVVGFLDIVLYYYMKEDEGQIKRLLLSMKTDEVIAKDRTDRLPPVIENPTVPMIHDIIFDTNYTHQ